MLETCSRLRETPCKWFDCGSVLNSLENLVAHLHGVHAQEDDLATCMWDICGETFVSWGELALHAEMHALIAIPCAHQDCDGVFASARELVAHNLGHAEENNAELLPCARPSVPPLEPLPLPPVPESVPAWGVLAPGVNMPEISRERHLLSYGPWVLRNITPKLQKTETKRYNAAKPLSAVQPFDPGSEFVATSAVHYSCWPSTAAKDRQMVDLDSNELTAKILNGEFVLWPPEGDEDQTDVKPVNAAMAAEEKTVPEANPDDRPVSMDEKVIFPEDFSNLPTVEKVVDETPIPLFLDVDEETVENMLQADLDGGIIQNAA
ncbi:hypothetical protein B0H19DRAFT_1147284 [Mycena capillaripes]|nr:hypothetical protein B0H19DRAFT_1147284 [Mycena capillaripes]